MKFTFNKSFLWLLILIVPIVKGYSQTSTCTSNTLWSWGNNRYGQIGDNTDIFKLSPVRITNTADWKQVSAGYDHSAGIKTDGSLWAWGRNDDKRLGDGTNTRRLTPVQIGTSKDWKQIQAGSTYTLALKTDGSLWSWGDNLDGYLGTGTSSNQNSPKQIGTSKNWVQFSAGGLHNVALKTDGSLWAWGVNSDGQLGDGTRDNRSTPVRVGTATDWKEVSAGSLMTAALKTDGSLWAWGANSDGQLGDGTTTNRISPVKIGNSTDWKQVNVGDSFTVALKTNGSLWAWGDNSKGQLGDGTGVDKLKPTQIGTETSWSWINAKENTFAFKCTPTNNCSTFPTPNLTIVQQSEASTITINNLPAGASSSIGGAFVVGKSVYDSGLTPGLVTVKMKLGSCTSEKTVRILARGFPQFDPACYRIVNKATGKALEVQTNSMADGAQIVQGVPNGSPNQSWQKVNFNFNFFSFLSKSNDKALTASSCASGTPVKQNAFIETDNQKWFVDELLDGSIKIKNRACGGDIGTLRASGNGTPNIDIAKDDGSDAFKWIVQAVACPNKCSFTPTITGASSVNIGGTIQLTGTPTSGTTQWTSSNYGIVGVSATGLVNALIDGTATINYFVTKDGCTANAVKIIKVNPVFDPEKCYTVTARHSGKVMEIAEHSTANGVNIQQGAWGYSRRQVWRFKSLSGAYVLTNGYSGKAVTVKGRSTDDGANIEQSQNTYADNQTWYLAKNAEGYYSLKNRFSGKMVDVSGASTANGANILQWAANGQNNQQWKIAAVGCPAGTVSSQSAEIYTAEGYREGQKGIITWLSNAANADYFTVEKQNKNGDFEALSTVNAKPMIDFSDKNYYSYTDNTTEEGENIYRVALVADNTPPQYSGLIALNFKATIDFALYPNPTSDYVEVDLLSYQDKAVALTLSDASGKEVRFVKIEKAAKTHRIELNDLTTGQYIMRIQTAGKRDVTRVLNVTK